VWLPVVEILVMRTALTAICTFTILASCWLFVMYLVLRHPGFEWRAALAVGYAAIGVLTLLAVHRFTDSSVWRAAACAGALALACAGVWAIRTNVDDGFADVIGIAFISQGLATMTYLLRAHGRRTQVS
jgi:hypothetical protein